MTSRYDLLDCMFRVLGKSANVKPYRVTHLCQGTLNDPRFIGIKQLVIEWNGQQVEGYESYDKEEEP